jgi:hypothetical protein
LTAVVLTIDRWIARRNTNPVRVALRARQHVGRIEPKA